MNEIQNNCIVSTVYDETRRKHHERHAMLFLLHLASWKENVSDQYPLRVVCITEPKSQIRDVIEASGGQIEILSARHELYDRGPCYNKHLAVPGNEQPVRVFLTDNDTIYLGAIEQLFSGHPSSVGVTFAPRARISSDMWNLLIEEFEAKPVDVCWRPEALYANSLLEGEGKHCAYERYGYFNGGAILFPEGNDFWQLWEKKSFALSQFLEDRGFHGQKSVGTDQASLCLAVAEYGNWELLPGGFNHFSFHYLLGNIKPWNVRHIHIAGIGRHYGRLDVNEKNSASIIINRYWENAILNPMKQLGRSDDEIDGAVMHRNFILNLIEEYDMEDLRKFSLPREKVGRIFLQRIHQYRRNLSVGMILKWITVRLQSFKIQLSQFLRNDRHNN